jgi:hypothetical protein
MLPAAACPTWHVELKRRRKQRGEEGKKGKEREKKLSWSKRPSRSERNLLLYPFCPYARARVAALL